MKIYFCGSIRGGRNDADLYAKIIAHLKSYGTVLTEHVGGTSTELKEEMKKDSKFIHARDMEWLSESDVVVAEVTQPSLGVGYEIGRAVAMKKPILCLFRPDPSRALSCMIDGAHTGDSFIVKYYSEPEYPEILKQYFEQLKK